MREVEVRIPGRPPGANALHRQGFWKVRKDREEWRGISHSAALAVRSGPPFARASLAVEWRCRTRRRRDYDNLVAGLKPLIDGLVSAGIIEDDDSAHLISLGPLTVTSGCPEDAVVLTVREEG